MPIKQAGKPQVSQSTYGSPEHSQHPYTGQIPDYDVPEANTPDQSVSAQTYGVIPTQSEPSTVQDTSAQDKITQMAGVGVGDDKFSAGPINGTAVYGSTKPTAEQAAGAGSAPNFPSGTYPPNPTPMQGPGDHPETQAVMPKLQVQGDPAQVYGVRHEEGGQGSGRHPEGHLNRIGQTYRPASPPQQGQQGRVVGTRPVDIGGYYVNAPVRRAAVALFSKAASPTEWITWRGRHVPVIDGKPSWESPHVHESSDALHPLGHGSHKIRAPTSDELQTLGKGWATIRGHRVFIPDAEDMRSAHDQMLSRGYAHMGSKPSETGTGTIHSYKAADGSHSVHFFANEDGMIGDRTVEDHTAQKASWKEAYDWPHTIVFDWNGTIDARGTSQGIPWREVQKLIDAGKHVVIFTSSVNNPDDKSFMRRFLSNKDVPYTDDPTILDKADIFVGDKKSDRRRAGFHGVKYIDATEFDTDKILAKSLDKGGPGSGKHPSGALGAVLGGAGIAGAMAIHGRQMSTPPPKVRTTVPNISQRISGTEQFAGQAQPLPYAVPHRPVPPQPLHEDVPTGMGAKVTTLPDGRQVTMSPQHDDTGKYQYHISEPVMVPRSEVQVDNPKQPLNPNKVDARQGRIQNQGIQNLKPLAAWTNGPGQPLTVVDGHHRIEAAGREGKPQVPVVVLSRSLRFAALKLFPQTGDSVTKPGYTHTVIDSKQNPTGQAEIGLGNVTRPQKEGKDVETP